MADAIRLTRMTRIGEEIDFLKIRRDEIAEIEQILRSRRDDLDAMIDGLMREARHLINEIKENP